MYLRAIVATSEGLEHVRRDRRSRGHDALEESLADRGGVALLMKAKPEHLARLDLRRLEVGVDAEDEVAALPLGLEQLERTGLEPRGDDQVGDLIVEHAGQREVDDRR